MSPRRRELPDERRRELVRYGERLAEIHADDPDTNLGFWIRATRGDLSRVAHDDDQERDRIFYAALLRRLLALRRQRRRRALHQLLTRLLPRRPF